MRTRRSFPAWWARAARRRGRTDVGLPGVAAAPVTTAAPAASSNPALQPIRTRRAATSPSDPGLQTESARINRDMAALGAAGAMAGLPLAALEIEARATLGKKSASVADSAVACLQAGYAAAPGQPRFELHTDAGVLASPVAQQYYIILVNGSNHRGATIARGDPKHNQEANK